MAKLTLLPGGAELEQRRHISSRVLELETALNNLLSIVLDSGLDPLPQVREAREALSGSGVKCRI